MAGGQVKAIALAVATAATAASVSPAQAVTGQELLRQCDALERGALVSGDTVRLPKSQDAATCWIYMGAVQDVSATVEEEGGPSLIGSCVPPETTRMELVRAFTRYARAHRADLDLRATALIIPALSQAFPCPMPGRTEAGPLKAG
jgi:hypothetical protein